MKKNFLFAVVLCTAFASQAQVRYFKGVLSGANETSPNASTASGVVIVQYNTATNSLSLHGNYRGLSNTISGSHIHGPAAAGVNAGVLYPIPNTGGVTGTLSLSTTISDAQETDLLAGLWYVNVHSTGTFAAGEIRAQLTLTTDGQTDFLKARLQGSQEVPPNPSTASGNGYVLLDKGTNMVYVTGSYTGLSANISGSHIHPGLPGATGGVLIGLVNSGGTSGTIEVATTVTDPQETQISTGGTYINVHSIGTYAAGEIRGQVTNLARLTYFGGTLSGAAETSPNSSTATGTVIVKYDPESNLLELTGDYQGLSNTISGSHIHGPATAGVNAGVLYPIPNTGGVTGTLSLSTTISDAQETDLLAGLWYVNVHSTGTFAAGEIRTQLIPTSAGRTQYLTANLQGSQEVPSNASTATGSATAILDAMTGKVFLTGTYTGLGSNASMAHIHQAPPGTSGDVVVPLAITTSTSGPVSGSGTLTPAQVNAMINGQMYVNIHSTLIGSGEIRGQLGNFVLPLKLASFTAFKEREKITLTWTVTQEINLLSYDIEQQDNETKAWKKKGTMVAKGGNGTISYNFTDLPVESKSPFVFYRLKMTDADGRISYSNVIKVNYQTGNGALTILSNPVRNGVLCYVLTGLAASETAEVSVMDYNGRVVLKARSALPGNNEINVANLSAGMYRLLINRKNEVIQESFVK